MTQSSKQASIYKQLLAYIKPYKGVLILGIFFGMLTGGALTGILMSAKQLISAFTNPNNALTTNFQLVEDLKNWIVNTLNLDLENNVSMGLFISGAIIFIFIYFFKALVTVLNRYCVRWVGTNVIMDLRNDLFSHLQKQSLSFYGKNDVGKLISRINADIGAIESAVSTSIAELSRSPFEIFGVFVFIVIFTVQNDILQLPLVMLTVVPIVFIPMVILSRKIRTYFRQTLKQIANLSSRMYEVFTGIRIVKAFHMEKGEEERFTAINNKYRSRVLKALRAQLGMALVIECFNVVLVLIMAFFLYAKGGISLEKIAIMVGAATLAYAPFKRLGRVNTQLQKSFAAAERVFDLFAVDTEIKERPNAIEVTEIKDKISFENVCFSYQNAEGEEFQIKNVNLEIPKGREAAFVGMTGCGKSTLANLLGRFYEVDSGAIKIDDVDIRDIKISSLRKLIGVVTQDTILFNETLSYNICYGSEIDENRMIEAAKNAEAYDFIMDKAEGFDRVTGDKGFQLSGGQKQRVAIARAIYRNPEILILDEATSALDTVTEHQVQKALNSLMKDRTVFTIAHRLSTIRNAHCIYYMENGEIVEQGTHQELLALNGKYFDLNENQRDDS